MSKTKDKGVKHYEILFILPNRFTEEEAKTLCGRAEKMITGNEGTITHREFWGKKKLAYEIKHNAFGYYGLFEFDLEGAKLGKLDNELRLDADILRHQIVVKHAKTAEELAKESKIQAKIDSKKAAEDKKKAEEEKAKAPAEAPAPKAEDRRAKLQDLDEKMDDILNAKDLM